VGDPRVGPVLVGGTQTLQGTCPVMVLQGQASFTIMGRALRMGQGAPNPVRPPGARRDTRAPSASHPTIHRPWPWSEGLVRGGAGPCYATSNEEDRLNPILSQREVIAIGLSRDDQTIASLYQIAGLRPEIWADLDVRERLRTLQEAENAIAAVQDRRRFMSQIDMVSIETDDLIPRLVSEFGYTPAFARRTARRLATGDERVKQAFWHWWRTGDVDNSVEGM